ncbi:MAG TPA: LamG-like jellyroll fold domain-containing protein [Verrucomicrobiae bacterium]|nr:LamG-like jellyroll fold domain-containing protein [Verrucomicrobiae bacterium]
MQITKSFQRFNKPSMRNWVILTALLVAGRLAAQPTGQWNFTNADLTATIGADLQYADGSGGPTQLGTAFGSTTSFGIPGINGTAVPVMKFPAATNGAGYLMTAPPSGNGGGGLVNDYTLIFDLLYPQASNSQLRPLIDTDGNLFFEGPDIVVDSSNGVGTTPGGPFGGTIAPNTWYRIGIVVQQDQNLVTLYVNGAKVASTTVTGTQSGKDGRFGLPPGSTVLILGTTDTNAAPGYVSSIQIRDVALNPGQMLALGGPSASKIPQTIPPVPAFIQSSTPGAGDTGVSPSPSISVVLNQGDTTVNSSSIKLLLDGALLPASVAATPPTFQITASVTNILDPQSKHNLSVVWTDSVAGNATNTFSFTVINYQNVTLPAPFYLETFDELSENNGGPTPLPAGWTVTNQTWTATEDPGVFNLDDLKSDSYADWVLISNTREFSWESGSVGEPHDRGDLPPIVLNGQLLSLSNFISGNLMWAESDQRCSGCWGQYQEMYTADIDCTGRTNVFVAFNSFYEQNQDNMNLVEYSIDQGKNWLPVRYFFCTLGNGEQSDIYYTNNAAGKPVIDIGQTFSLPDPNRNWAPWPAGCTDLTVCPPHNTNYGIYLKAPISTNLIPYIAGYTNDDTMSSKEIVVVRLAQADGQKTVRFRFLDDGTSSWFWGIDNLGLYEINTPVINTQPESQSIDAGTPVTFSVVAASNSPLTYQWQFGGVNIPGAINSSYTIQSVSPSDVGQYKVLVKNSDGTTSSDPANLTVNTTPAISGQPLSQVAYLGASVTLSATVTGGRPLTSLWYRGGQLVSSSTGASLTLNPVQLSDAGNYVLVLSNSFGTNASAPFTLFVFSGSISNSLLAHLKFDGDYKDVSGNGTDGSAVGTPSFQTGLIGQAVHVTSSGSPADAPATNNYVTFGTGPNLHFGTNDFSVSFWAKVLSQNDDKPFISNKDWNSGNNPGWVISTEGGGTKWNLKDDQSGRRDSPSVAPKLEDGNWHNLIVTFIRSAVATIYVDGQVVNVTSVGPDAGKPVGSADTTLPVNIGQDGTGHYTDHGSGASLDMLMDDLGIWQRSLTPSEVTAIYTAGQTGKDLSLAQVSLSPARPSLRITVTGNSVQLSWQGSATSKLQTNSSLNPSTWTDVPNTTGASSATVPVSGASAFFRVSQ